MIRMCSTRKCVFAKTDTDEVIIGVLDVVSDIDIVTHTARYVLNIRRRQISEVLFETSEGLRDPHLYKLIKSIDIRSTRQLRILTRKLSLLQLDRFFHLARHELGVSKKHHLLPRVEREPAVLLPRL